MAYQDISKKCTALNVCLRKGDIFNINHLSKHHKKKQKSKQDLTRKSVNKKGKTRNQLNIRQIHNRKKSTK